MWNVTIPLFSQSTWMYFKYVEEYNIIIYYLFFFFLVSKSVCYSNKYSYGEFYFLIDINLKKWWNHFFKSVLIELPCVNIVIYWYQNGMFYTYQCTGLIRPFGVPDFSRTCKRKHHLCTLFGIGGSHIAR